jgi:hypothetical protein
VVAGDSRHTHDLSAHPAGVIGCWIRHASMEKSRGHRGEGEQVSTLTDAVLAFLRSALLK